MFLKYIKQTPGYLFYKHRRKWFIMGFKLNLKPTKVPKIFWSLLSLEKAQTQAEKALLKDFVMLEIEFWNSSAFLKTL